MERGKSRVVYLDIARGLAVLFMFTQHCILVHEKTAGEGTNLLANIFVLLGTAPAAPVFMLIMGVFIAATKSDTKTILLRGAKIFALGYLLNFLRFTIPLFLAEKVGFQLIDGETPLNMFFAVDILQLAGLSFIVGAFTKNVLKNKIVAYLFIVAILLISPSLWGNFGNSALLSILWGVDKNVFFPFFPWFVYPLLGIYLSKILLNVDQNKKKIKMLVLVGFALFGIGILTYDLFPVGDYHRSGAAIHLLIIGFILMWLVACWWISEKISSTNTVVSTLVLWSKNVTAMYFIQWVLFGWSILIFDANKLNAHAAALVGLAILIITHFLIKKSFVKKAFSWI